MPLNNNEKKNYIFEGKIRQYEEELVKIFLEIGKRRGQNPIITKILSYLMIHGDLTQKQLKKLTHCSIGSISTHLAAMISIGFVEKKLIPGTHTYRYYLNIDIGQNISSLMNTSKEYIIQGKEFLKSKKAELNDILQKKKQIFEPIMERFEELELVIQMYVLLFEQVLNSEKVEIKLDIPMLKEGDPIQELSEEIKYIENDVIDFFTYTPMFFGKTEIFSQTFAYFITRRNLNQKKLRELTGLSSGKVSEEINKLLDLGIIEIINKSESGQIIYQMKSVLLAFLRVSFNVLSEYMKWKETIENINSILEKEKENLKELNGYNEIIKVVKMFLKILPFFEKIYYAIVKIRNQAGLS